jgi:cation transport protein ChaC
MSEREIRHVVEDPAGPTPPAVLVPGRAALLASLTPGADIWVFAYGSLLWDPGFDFVDSAPAQLYGYHRQFCIYSWIYRGTERHPGLVLGLDRGGSCHGRAYRVRARNARRVLGYLWDREMTSNVYMHRLLTARRRGPRGPSVPCHTWAADRGHPQYAGRLPIAEAAKIIARAVGRSGANHAYLRNTVGHLDALGIGDGPLHRLLDLVDRRLRDGAP